MARYFGDNKNRLAELVARRARPPRRHAPAASATRPIAGLVQNSCIIFITMEQSRYSKMRVRIEGRVTGHTHSTQLRKRSSRAGIAATSRHGELDGARPRPTVENETRLPRAELRLHGLFVVIPKVYASPRPEPHPLTILSTLVQGLNPEPARPTGAAVYPSPTT
ncbi:hypothetical protein EVAR_6945_1 [Eumeta japonica]|uniref:Uncharacterized protein n=1 Tax=Eumeta variegata TaxID=151549 RepID=A0A4C1TJI6_EUMVA|nr:hypothetical protein EVAR_6945_1 [Eumeta japonica]